MLVAQTRHLLGPKARGERFLHVDGRQPLREAVEHIGVGVAVLNALGHALVHLVEIAGHDDQQLAVVRSPAAWVVAELLELLLHDLGRPAHDVRDRFAELERLLQIARVEGREVERRLLPWLLARRVFVIVLFVGLVHPRAHGLVLVISLFEFDAVERVHGRRKTAVREQRPHVLIALDGHILALAIAGAKTLEFIEQQNAGLAFHHGGISQHLGNRVAGRSTHAVAEAVHLHFQKAVVEAQQLGQTTHQLGLAGAGQTPEADDDRAVDHLGQQIPRAHRIDEPIDQRVEPEELGFQRVGGDVQHLLAQCHAVAEQGLCVVCLVVDVHCVVGCRCSSCGCCRGDG